MRPPIIVVQRQVEGEVQQRRPRQDQFVRLVVTHDTRSMRRVGNRVMLLHHGEIHANGTPDEIFNSTDPIVHKFVNGIADPKDLEF